LDNTRKIHILSYEALLNEIYCQSTERMAELRFLSDYSKGMLSTTIHLALISHLHSTLFLSLVQQGSSVAWFAKLSSSPFLGGIPSLHILLTCRQALSSQ
jgi:hypothetical protein